MSDKKKDFLEAAEQAQSFGVSNIRIQADEAIGTWPSICLRISNFLLIGGCLCTCASLPISLVAMHVGLVMMLSGVLLGLRPIHKMPGFVWGCLFAFWQILGMVVRADWDSRPILLQGHGTAFIWLVLFPTILVLAEVRWRRWTLHLMMLALASSFVLVLIQFFVGNGGVRPFRVSYENGVRMTHSCGFMPLHLTQGFIMTMMAIVFWSHRSSSEVSKVAVWTGRLISLAAVLLANSRTGLMALLGGFTAWFAAAKGRFRWWSIGVVIFGAPLLAGWLWMVNPGVLKAMMHLQDGRLIIWEVATHVIGENPWFGVGEGKFHLANDRWLGVLYPDHSQDTWLKTPDAHNSILGLASEHGLPALALFIVFIASILRHLYQRRHSDSRAWQLGCGAVGALAVGSQFEHYVGHSAPSYAFFIALAFALASEREVAARANNKV